MANKWAAGNYMGSGMSKGAYLASKKKPTTKSVSSKSSVKYTTPTFASGQTGLPIAGTVDKKTAAIRQAAIDRTPALDYSGKASEYAYGGSAMEKSSKTASSKGSSKSKSKTTSKTSDALGGKSFVEASKDLNASKTKTTSIRPNTNPTTTSSPWRKALGQGLDYIKMANPTVGALAKGLSNFNFDLTDVLGIPRAEASVGDYWDEQGRLEDQRRVATNINDLLGRDVLSMPQDYREVTSTRTTSPVTTDITETTSSDNRDRRTPTRISTPYIAPVQTSVPEVSQSYSPQSTPDFTGQSSQTRGTVRRPVGMGEFSRGQYSNGAGGYGFQGSIGDTGDVSTEQDLLNKILGISTAEASELPMTNTPLVNPNFYRMSSMQNPTPSAETYLGAPTQTRPTGANYVGGYTTQRQGTNTPSAPRIQSSQPNESFGYDQQIKDQERAYKQQQKAQERALKELLKSINAQYDVSTKEGTQALEKQKQEDLLRLSGLFGFANQDPSSEQRIQYQQRAEASAQEQLANLLAKLGQGRSQDILGARQNYQSQLSNLEQQRANALQQIREAQQARADKQWERDYKMMALNKRGGSQKAGSITYLGNDENGNPVYYNSTTGQQQRYPGVTRQQDPFTTWLNSQGGGQQGGSWEIDPETGEQVWVTG